MKKCQIRKDLTEQDLLIPVGDTYIEQLDPSLYFDYRWKKGTFQIKVDGKFQEANSIDFDFTERGTNHV